MFLFKLFWIVIYTVKFLELLSGTKSVGKVAERLGCEVISSDLTNADINHNILDWGYTTFPVGYVDVIWASPSCDTFSRLKESNIGRNGYTKESIQSYIDNIGLPILRNSEEIINHFQPNYYFFENPQTGKWTIIYICIYKNNLMMLIIVNTQIGDTRREQEYVLI